MVKARNRIECMNIPTKKKATFVRHAPQHTTYSDPHDKMKQCERCDKWICLSFSGLTYKEYDVLAESESKMHWHCKNCNQAAVTALKADDLIEENARNTSPPTKKQ